MFTRRMLHFLARRSFQVEFGHKDMGMAFLKWQGIDFENISWALL